MATTLNPTAQIQKARNAKRTTDLYQIRYALANFSIANGKYPVTLPFGSAWGTYMGFVPNDPSYPAKKYAYSVAPDEQSYYLYASLEGNENNNNIECNGGICPGTNCGSGEGSCNYGISSSNAIKECKVFPANCTNSSDHGCCESLGYTCQDAFIGGWKCRLSPSPTATPSSALTPTPTSPTPAPTSAPTQIPTCTDSDGGKNYSVKGTTYGPHVNNTDTCYQDGIGLQEQYCNSLGTQSADYYNCPNGCEDGACVQSVACPDIDSKSLVLTASDVGTGYSSVGQYVTMIDPGVNFGFQKSLQSGYQILKTSGNDAMSFIFLRYSTSSDAKHMFDISNTRHTRTVLFNDSSVGKETFCHETEERYARTGNYSFICGFWYDKVYVDVQWITATHSYAAAMENLNKIYQKILAYCPVSGSP